MADDEDKLVTKPFKFVTGKCLILGSLHAFETDVHGSRSAPSTSSFIMATLNLVSVSSNSMTEILALGFDARFPNQNQYVLNHFLLLDIVFMLP